MQCKNYFVYIATNKANKVLYIGVTSNIFKRIWQHQQKISPDSFTAKYNINKLVYYERYGDIEVAIQREKQLKSGSRQKKLKLIIDLNPEWKDLSIEEL